LKDKWKKIKEWLKKDKKRSVFLAIMVFLVALSFIPTPPAPKDTNHGKQAEVVTKGKGQKVEEKKDGSEVSYVAFQKMLKEGKVKEAVINLNSPTFTFKDDKKKEYTTENPKTEIFKETLLKANVTVHEFDKTVTEQWMNVARSLIPMVIFIFIFIYLSKSMKPVNTKSKQNAVVPKTVFDHIAGNEESKEEMKFLVDFLKRPARFTKMGAKLPKGVILYGPPGTGKTLIAKAIAGEGKVPFFSLSGSDFVEMYVGVGAKRVRELFEEARKKSPSIIFIDEIDSLGSNRDASSNSEDRKTLNAILNEMDGFRENSGIVVIGATNRLEDLDPAFIRPGRFDKHIAIALPDIKGRLEILKHHAQNKPLAPDVKLENLAKITMGMSGAYLETLLNEATILATTRNRNVVTEEDIDDAYYKLIVKGHKKKRDSKEQEKEIEIVAWHESGHALVAKLLNTSDVPKVTITPSTTGIGGFALITPKKQGLYSKVELEDRVKGLYAGRIAEHLLLNDENQITIGASQDIKQATDIIKGMILDYGMSEKYGMINLASLGDPRMVHLADNESFVKEATELSKKLYKEAFDLLSKEKHVLKAIAETLMEKETIVEEELEAIIKLHTASELEG
jgi:cell division protease FtsH